MRDGGHGLQNLMLGIALLLAAIIVYCGARRFIQRGRAAAPAKPAAAVRPDEAPASGMSGMIEPVNSIPPIVLQKSGRLGSSRYKSKAPPAPKVKKGE